MSTETQRKERDLAFIKRLMSVEGWSSVHAAVRTHQRDWSHIVKYCALRKVIWICDLGPMSFFILRLL